MSETKPQKRLVSKRQFVLTVGKKAGLYSSATVLLFFGILYFTIGLGCMLFHACLLYWQHAPIEPRSVHADPYYFAHVGLALEVALPGLWIGKSLFIRAKTVEPVALITFQNAHLLPVQETLLRGSDLPSTVPQAELLRATQAAQEIAGEELLRATTSEE